MTNNAGEFETLYIKQIYDREGIISVYVSPHIPSCYVHPRTLDLFFLSVICYISFFRRSACSCATDDATRIYLKDLQMDYYYGLKELIDSGKYDSRDDFTVVLQPYVVELTPWIDVRLQSLSNETFAIIFTHLKLWIASARHNFKWVKIQCHH